jgi:E3 ubiquitin-protein ligase AIP2
MQQHGRVGNPPASKKAIDSLPEVNICEKYCKQAENSNNLELPRCAICYEDLNEKGTILPCGHLYDRECISKWLMEHNQCPVCRHELETEDEEYESRKRN